MGSESPGSWAARLEAVQSGAAVGPAAALLRGALTLVSGAYVAGRFLHRRLYTSGLRSRCRLPQPVVSIGNLTAGGTGKTPLVAWLASALRERGIEPAVLARGYGRRPGEDLNEEGRWLAERLPGLAVIQDADRVAAATEFLRRSRCDLFLLDDGFQHERIHRDLEWVVLDALRPFGYGHRLPRGLLRDSPSELRRAHSVIVTRCELLDDAARDRLAARVKSLAPEAALSFARFEVEQVRVGASLRPASELRGRRMLVACAVGHPAAVQRTAERLGVEVVGLVAYRDHHRFTAADAADVLRQAQSRGAEVLVTEKDEVKLRGVWGRGNAPPWVLCQTVVVDAAEDLLDPLLACLQRRTGVTTERSAPA